MQMFLFYVLKTLSFLLLLDVGLSWAMAAGARISRSNPLVKLLHSITEPILTPFRRLLPHPSKTANFDLAPMLALLSIIVLQNLILGL
ncbi:MAG: YggT family protein [Chthonomonadaceae bacterium]|nr:YggT family protein [Chthonomonadaceae bacterium]